MSDRTHAQQHPEPAAAAGRRWLVLGVGAIALTAGATFQYGLAYLIPAFRQEGLSLEQAGILVACPTAGLLLTLVAWGGAADRGGERLVLRGGRGPVGGRLPAAGESGWCSGGAWPWPGRSCWPGPPCTGRPRSAPAWPRPAPRGR